MAEPIPALHIRISPTLAEKVRVTAAELEVSAAQFVRLAIRRMMEEMEK